MTRDEGGLRRQRRQWWLSAGAVVAGGLSLLASVVAIVGAVLAVNSVHLLPTARKTLLIQARLELAFFFAVGGGVIGLGLALASRRKSAGLPICGLLFAIMTLLFLSSFLQRHGRAPGPPCLANVKNMAIALNMYLTEYDRSPQGAVWSDELLGYVRNRDSYRCPEATGTCAYAYNAALSGRRGSAVADPQRVVAFFESDRGWNAHGGKELMTDFARHSGGENVGFPDGHAKWYARRKPAGGVRENTKWPHAFGPPDLRWEPAGAVRAAP